MEEFDRRPLTEDELHKRLLKAADRQLKLAQRVIDEPTKLENIFARGLNSRPKAEVKPSPLMVMTPSQT